VNVTLPLPSQPLEPRPDSPDRAPIVLVSGLSHAYSGRRVLQDVHLRVYPGELFGFLGPNGSGKTTLFRLLSTLVAHQEGELRLFGEDLRASLSSIRRRLGVVFQAPSLDRKLTVQENLRHQGHLYGLRGTGLERRIQEMLERLDIVARAPDRVETLSGGMQRRVELAKGLLHRPEMLILDEPSTGLDPSARRDLWEHLVNLQRGEGVTILVTTHLMDEAERCQRLAILDQGHIVAVETPSSLKRRIGGDIIRMRTPDPAALQRRVLERFGGDATVVEGEVRLERADGHKLLEPLVEAFGDEIEEITLGRPTLEDVFVHLTGHRFRADRAAGTGG